MAHSGARRVGALAALSWLLAAGLTGTVAWRAVAVIDDGAPRTGVLSGPEVAAALASARATPAPSAASATPTATPPQPSPSSAGPTPPVHTVPPPVPTSDPAPVQPSAVAQTWSVTGGTVAAACTGAAISLLYATPQDGWTLEVGSTGPEHLEIELTQGEQETHVRAVCVNGAPVQTAERAEHSQDSEG